MHIIRKFTFAITTVAATQVMAGENTPAEVIRYLQKQGPVIEYKLFHSERPFAQLVVSYCIDENLEGGKNEGASNPANVHCEVALFNRRSSWVFASRASIGQGSIQEFKDGVVRGNVISYASEDPLCCPSKENEIVFKTLGGKLVESRK